MTTNIPFATDFSQLVEPLAQGRELPAVHLLSHVGGLEVLGPLDRQLVSSTVDVLTKDARAIEASLRDVLELQKFLHEQLNTTNSDLSRYKSLVAPIRRLPVEILQEIFLCVKPEQSPSLDQRNHIPIGARVNQHWRRIALATPRLWTTHVVTLGRDETSRFEGQMNSLHMYMERSKRHPVSFVISTTNSAMPFRHRRAYESLEDRYAEAREDSDFDSDDANEYSGRKEELDETVERINHVAAKLALAIRPYLPRMGSITVLEYSDTFQHFLDSLDLLTVPADLTRLRSLALPRNTWGRGSALLLHQTPNLERLFIVSNHWEDSPNSVTKSIPWTQLKLKTFSGCLDENDLETLLSSASSQLQLAEITTYSLPSLSSPSSGAGPYPPLQNLTSLYLKIAVIPLPTDSLPPLPSLLHLIFEPDYIPSTRPTFRRYDEPQAQPPIGLDPHILALIKRWGLQLDYFGLELSTILDKSGSRVTSDSIHDIIVAAPNLKAIGIPSYWSSELNRIVQSLTQLSHVEIFNSLLPDYSSYDQPVEPDESSDEWSRETLNRLETITFVGARSEKLISMIEAVKAKVEEEQLQVNVSWDVRDSYSYSPTRFSTPYFVRQGGLFAQ